MTPTIGIIIVVLISLALFYLLNLIAHLIKKRQQKRLYEELMFKRFLQIALRINAQMELEEIFLGEYKNDKN